MLALFFFVSLSSRGQEDNLGLVIGDLLEVSSDFVVPAGKATVYQSVSGWFVSAKPMDLWEIGFSIYGNALFVPKNKTTSHVSNSDYRVIEIRGAETATTPTAFGGDTDIFYDGEIVLFGQTTPFEFQALEGIGKRTVIHPFVQVSVGLPFNTDFTARYAPMLDIDDVEILNFGLALKHNLNRYFQNSTTEDFQFAALLAYSKFKVDYRYDPLNIEGVAKFDALRVNSDIWAFQLISSKSFLNTRFEASAAIGVSNADFEYALGGEGPALKGLNQALQTIGDNETTITAHLGANYKTGRFTISSMIVFWEYSNLTLGLSYRL